MMMEPTYIYPYIISYQDRYRLKESGKKESLAHLSSTHLVIYHSPSKSALLGFIYLKENEISSPIFHRISDYIKLTHAICTNHMKQPHNDILYIWLLFVIVVCV